MRLASVPFLFAASLVLAQARPASLFAQTGADLAVHAASPDSVASRAESDWYQPTRVTIHAANGNRSADTLYEIADNQDMRITIDATKNGEEHTSQIMLINGARRWMLTKNASLRPGYEIDTLDGPLLELKLAMELLHQASPNGPLGVTQKTIVKRSESRHAIAVSATSASSGIEAPWSLEASIDPTTPEQVSFDLAIKHSATIHLTGTWEKQASPVAFGDDISLDGWQILSIGSQKSSAGHGVDYAARRSKVRVATLGELRQLSAE
jgi:hypothetical protein